MSTPQRGERDERQARSPIAPHGRQRGSFQRLDDDHDDDSRLGRLESKKYILKRKIEKKVNLTPEETAPWELVRVSYSP